MSNINRELNDLPFNPGATQMDSFTVHFLRAVECVSQLEGSVTVSEPAINLVVT